MTASEQDWSRDKVEFAATRWEGSYDSGKNSAETESLAGPLCREFAQLTRSLLGVASVVQALDQVVTVTHRIVPGADLVSITLRTSDGTFHTPVSTDRAAHELDELQYDTGEGPCVAAGCRTGPAYVISGDVAREPGWPVFGPAAAERGFVAVLSTALLADSRPPQLTGALNIYSRTLHGLGAEARDMALLLATHASLALATVKALSTAELQVAHLRKAIDSRDVIGQAKGILMQRRGITAEDAFDLLRRTSQDLNVKLAQLAETLATRHTELDLPVQQ